MILDHPPPQTATPPPVIPSSLFIPWPLANSLFHGGGERVIPVTSLEVDLGRKVRHSLSLGFALQTSGGRTIWQ